MRPLLPLVCLLCCTSATPNARPDASVEPERPEAIDGCTPPSGDLRAFPECEVGGGVFGRWIVDEQGLPAFEYTLDERSDARARWTDSEGRERRDHFVMLGNDRVHFKAVNEGWVELFGSERGPTWLNRFSEPQRNLGGGFSYVSEDGAVWTSAHRWAPAGSTSRRVFGVGYFETTTTHAGLSVRHRVFAPEGDAPVLVDEVTLVNHAAHARTLRHYEYWDVNRHQLSIEWVRTGLAAAPSDRGRDGHNERFTQAVRWDAAKKTLVASMSPKPTETPVDRETPSGLDWYPPDVFLTALDAEVHAFHADQRAFFASGPPERPAAVAALGSGGELAPTSAAGQPACLVMRSDLTLAGGESKTLRFAYGYLPRGKSLDGVLGQVPAGAFADSLARWKKRLVYADIPGRPLFHREAAWRTHLLLSHSGMSDYFGTHYTAQGSAYLYLHGADGAPRDQALFAAALAYVDPQLAKGNLRQVMSLADATTAEIAYSFTNFGQVDGASGLHDEPSDLDLFLLFGLAEYLAATGDLAFLDERVPFYPRGAGRPAFVGSDSVLDHARAAFHHLKNGVGLGAHGLIRLGDGDWSDGIVYEDLSPLAIANTERDGESVPNSQMALVVLPLLAGQLEGVDASFATELRAYAQQLAPAVKATFGSRWFARAWVKNSIGQSYLKGNDQQSDGFRANFIDLEAQPWGVLADVVSAEQRERVLDEVDARLDAPSAIGPTMREGGAVWPAISQLMTWAWARHRRADAWRALDEQLYATHARVFPEQWLGVWAGPDGFESKAPGGTWASPVTPMTDFPVNNMNPEAMWLFGLVRAAGVEPSAGGLSITPSGRYTVDLPLLRLEVEPGRVSGVYRAKNSGSLVLRVRTPGGERAIPLSFSAGDAVPFETRW